MAFCHFDCLVAIRIPKEAEVEIVPVGVDPAIPTVAAGHSVAAVVPIESVGHIPVAGIPIGIAPYMMVVGKAIESVGHIPVAGIPIGIVGSVAAVSAIEAVGCIAAVGIPVGTGCSVVAALAIEAVVTPIGIAQYWVVAGSCYNTPFIVQYLVVTCEVA
jgi:hypothetical protein